MILNYRTKNFTINIKKCSEVYPPSEDTFMIIEYLENNIDSFKGPCIEVGCGSGIISIFLALNGFDVTSIDIDKRAVECTKINFSLNQINGNVIRSDLFENVKQQYKLIIFNPPYLPEDEYDNKSTEMLQWSGGKTGYNTTLRFLIEAMNHLSDVGKILTIVSDRTEYVKMLTNVSELYKFRVLSETKFFFETIKLMEFTKR
ncbi:HemK2/MTQ2 family protein methyltransferase [Caldiplasma sukawensis]